MKTAIKLPKKVDVLLIYNLPSWWAFSTDCLKRCNSEPACCHGSCFVIIQSQCRCHDARSMPSVVMFCLIAAFKHAILCSNKRKFSILDSFFGIKPAQAKKQNTNLTMHPEEKTSAGYKNGFQESWKCSQSWLKFDRKRNVIFVICARSTRFVGEWLINVGWRRWSKNFAFQQSYWTWDK